MCGYGKSRPLGRLVGARLVGHFPLGRFGHFPLGRFGRFRPTRAHLTSQIAGSWEGDATREPAGETAAEAAGEGDGDED